MARFGSFFSNFVSLFLIIMLHLGCFVSPASDSSGSPSRKASKSRKSAASPSLFKPRRSISSSWSYLKSYFTQKNPKSDRSPATDAISSLTLVSLVPPEPQFQESETTHQASDLTVRNDETIIPCSACGEIFYKRQLLEQHLAVKHAVSELSGEDSGHKIVKIIFTTSWTNKNWIPKINRILKIHNSPKILSRFEEYREVIKSKAAARSSFGGGGRRWNGRCIADGNELLRFHCSTFMCELGQDGNSALCNKQFCSVCGIIKLGFSAKLDGIPTLSTSWKAHVAIPDETLEEFRFMNVKRAVLICRVVAGRVGADGDEADKESGGFDSVVGRGGSGDLTRVDEEELLVLNPRAVLPCFVVVYTV